MRPILYRQDPDSDPGPSQGQRHQVQWTSGSYPREGGGLQAAVSEDGHLRDHPESREAAQDKWSRSPPDIAPDPGAEHQEANPDRDQDNGCPQQAPVHCKLRKPYHCLHQQGLQ